MVGQVEVMPDMSQKSLLLDTNMQSLVDVVRELKASVSQMNNQQVSNQRIPDPVQQQMLDL